jgi:DNA-binding IclR family transcriptional regulator
MATQEPKTETVGTVLRVINLLAVVAESRDGVRLSGIAQSVGLPESTTHRLLQLLCDSDIAVKDPRTHLYSPGPEFYRISSRVVATVQPARIAEPIVERLAEETNETVLLGLYLPAQKAMAFVVRHDGTQALQYRIQMHSPISVLVGASGLAILAHLSPAVIDAIIEEEEQTGGASTIDVTELHRQIAITRERGYAVTEGQRLPGARGIAAPIMGSTGVLGSLLLTSPIERLRPDSIDPIGRQIKEAAQEISQLLGYEPKDAR